MKLIYWPNLILKKVSVPLSEDRLHSSELKELVRGMAEIMKEHKGVGLSAIQVGVAERLFLLHKNEHHHDRPAEYFAYANPVIVEYVDEAILMEEGCLSVPGVVEKVMRFRQVIVKAFDVRLGEEVKLDLWGLDAQCTQHEIDHMDGKLFMDSLTIVKRDIARRKVQKATRNRR